MPDLIFSRRHDDTALSVAEIAEKAPAVFARTHRDDLTSRYGHVTTAEAIDVLADYGFRPVQAAQVSGRKKTSVDHAQHLIAFAKERAEMLEGTRPELILYNSHDGQSSLKLFAGAYRFICSNGIVAGDGFESRIRHTKNSVAGFEEMLRETAANLPDLMGRIQTMQRQTVTDSEMLDFAWNAARLRWEMLPTAEEMAIDGPPTSGAYITEDTVSDLLTPRRYGDGGRDAWTVYNRVQEGVIRGGGFLQSYSAKYPQGRKRKARPVANVKGNVDINRDLWNMAANQFEFNRLPQAIPAIAAE